MLIRYAVIFDGSENDIFRIKNVFSYFCSNNRRLFGTLRRFFKTNINIMYNYEGAGIKKVWVGVGIFKVS